MREDVNIQRFASVTCYLGIRVSMSGERGGVAWFSGLPQPIYSGCARAEPGRVPSHPTEIRRPQR